LTNELAIADPAVRIRLAQALAELPPSVALTAAAFLKMLDQRSGLAE
jgi:hypothetical protein